MALYITIAFISIGGVLLLVSGDPPSLRVCYGRLPNIVFYDKLIFAGCYICPQNEYDTITWVILYEGTFPVILNEEDPRILGSARDILQEMVGISGISKEDANKTLSWVRQIESENGISSTPCARELLWSYFATVEVKEMHNAVVACHDGPLYNSSTACLNLDKCARSKSLYVDLGPSKPLSLELLSKYSTPNLEVGQTIRAVCSVCAGGNNDVFWYIKWRNEIVEPITRNTPGVQRFSKSYGITHQECHHTVIGTVHIHLTTDYNGIKIRCYSYNFSDTSYTVPGRDSFYDETNELNITAVTKRQMSRVGYVGMFSYMICLMFLSFFAFMVMNEEPMLIELDSRYKSSLENSEIQMVSEKANISPSMLASVPSSLSRLPNELSSRVAKYGTAVDDTRFC